MNLAYKYADAFVNVYNGQLNVENIERIKKVITFLQEHSRALFLLQVPVINQQLKEKGCVSLGKRFGLIEPVQYLIKLLLKHKRVYLLVEVLQAIVERYQQRHDIQSVRVKSSLPLPDTYRHEIEQFIDRHITGIKQYHYIVDTTLIAGIRIEGDTFLWEYSINKRLRDIAHARSW